MVNLKAAAMTTTVFAVVCLILTSVSLWKCSVMACPMINASLIVSTVICVILAVVFMVLWNRSQLKASQTLSASASPAQIVTQPQATTAHPVWVADTKMKTVTLPTGIDDGTRSAFLAYPGYNLVRVMGASDSAVITHTDNIGSATGNIAGVSEGPFELRQDVGNDTTTNIVRPTLARVFRYGNVNDLAGYVVQEDPLCTTYLPNPLPLTTHL